MKIITFTSEFYAPNHTYDKNTFEALKISGISQVIDGYGLIPYVEHEIKFIPQLFYKPIYYLWNSIHTNSP